MRYEEDSVYTDASRGTTNRAGATDDEQSYYTHFSDGSMGLSKRRNKQLSLVSYVPMGDDSSTTNPQEREEDDNGERSSVEGRDDHNGRDHRRRRSSSRSRRSRSSSQGRRRSSSQGRRRSSSQGRRRSSSQGRSKSSDRTEASSTVSHSTSTHKTRGSRAEPMRPVLTAIADAGSKEELGEDWQYQETERQRYTSPTKSPGRRMAAEDIRHGQDDDRADSRSRRRERLARLARIRNSPGRERPSEKSFGRERPDIEESPRARDRSVSPRKKVAPKSALKTPKYSSSPSTSPIKSSRKSPMKSGSRSYSYDNELAMNETRARERTPSPQKSSKRPSAPKEVEDPYPIITQGSSDAVVDQAPEADTEEEEEEVVKEPTDTYFGEKSSEQDRDGSSKHTSQKPRRTPERVRHDGHANNQTTASRHDNHVNNEANASRYASPPVNRLEEFQLESAGSPRQFQKSPSKRQERQASSNPSTPTRKYKASSNPSTPTRKYKASSNPATPTRKYEVVVNQSEPQIDRFASPPSQRQEAVQENLGKSPVKHHVSPVDQRAQSLSPSRQRRHSPQKTRYIVGQPASFVSPPTSPHGHGSIASPHASPMHASYMSSPMGSMYGSQPPSPRVSQWEPHSPTYDAADMIPSNVKYYPYNPNANGSMHASMGHGAMPMQQPMQPHMQQHMQQTMQQPMQPHMQQHMQQTTQQPMQQHMQQYMQQPMQQPMPQPIPQLMGYNAMAMQQPMTEANRYHDDCDDTASVVTSNLQPTPCLQQFVRTSRFVQRGPDGKPIGYGGYTQKCTSFVSGVWQSCAQGIGGYQTESKQNLLQLEMIAEQSVSSIYQSSATNTAPEAFQHSNELLAKAQAADSRSEDDSANHPFGINVEGALASFTNKIQEAVGLKEGNESSSVIDDMKNMFDSLSGLSNMYGPQNNTYVDETNVPMPPIQTRFQYRHGVFDNAASDTSFLDGDTTDEEEDIDLLCDHNTKGKGSIYATVSHGRDRDRRTMMMELQKRRWKNAAPRKEAEPEKVEDETQQLRQVYLALHNKIHDENEQPNTEPENSGKDGPELKRIICDIQENRDAKTNDIPDDTVNVQSSVDELEEERDIVWAASTATNGTRLQEGEAPVGQSVDNTVEKVSSKALGDDISASVSARDLQNSVTDASAPDTNADKYEIPSDPTVSVGETSDESAEGDSDDDMYTAVGTITGIPQEPAPTEPSANGPGNEASQSRHTSHTNSTMTTNDMEDLIDSFLDSPEPIPEETENEIEEAVSGEAVAEIENQDSEADPAIEEGDSESVQSGDPTLADSTIMSGLSSSQSRHTQDMSLAESMNSGSSSSRTTDATPEPSEVPPEIDQPRGPINDYQVLYQISEEEGEDDESSSEEEEEEYAENEDPHMDNDIPFDEAAPTAEATQQEQAVQAKKSSGSTFGLISKFFKWLLTLCLASYLGAFGGSIFDFLPAFDDEAANGAMAPKVLVPDELPPALEQTPGIDEPQQHAADHLVSAGASSTS